MCQQLLITIIIFSLWKKIQNLKKNLLLRIELDENNSLQYSY